jgi:hypothetical protein
VAGENVEDKLGAIHDTDGEGAFQVPELGGGKIVIEEDQSGPCRLRNGGDLIDLALTNERRWVRSGPALKHFRDHISPGTGHQLAKFGEGRFAVCSWMLRRVSVGRAGRLGRFARKGSGAR